MIKIYPPDVFRIKLHILLVVEIKIPKVTDKKCSKVDERKGVRDFHSEAMRDRGCAVKGSAREPSALPWGRVLLLVAGNSSKGNRRSSVVAL